MIECLTHYFKRGTLPFQSLSSLNEAEAVRIMEELCDDTPILSRFKQPIQYMNHRKQVEKWLWDEFSAKGGRPKNHYPIYAVLGSSPWIEQFASASEMDKIRVPLSLLQETDISFTYPDSMVSYTYAHDRPPDYYQPEFHGKVFTISEIKAIVNLYGLPEGNWGNTLPDDVGSYIEAQIWNDQLLRNLLESV